jgi:single-strand DNA-binding protein
MINKITLIGRLGKDAELKTLENGVQYSQLSIATDNNYKDAKGDWQKETTWHPITVWRDLATRYSALKKGDLVYVEGSVDIRSYIDSSGTKQQRYGVTGSIIRHLDKKPEPIPEPVPPPQYSYTAADTDKKDDTSKDDDGLPF